MQLRHCIGKEVNKIPVILCFLLKTTICTGAGSAAKSSPLIPAAAAACYSLATVPGPEDKVS